MNTVYFILLLLNLTLYNMKQICLYLLLLFFIVNHVSSQTIVTGKVFDADTKEPVAFANIVFKGTSIGTTADLEGNFTLKTDKPVDSLLFAYIGYDKKVVAVKKGQSQTINMAMTAAGVALQEVVIRPGENPAHKYIKKVIANKYKNDRKELNAYSYEAYNKIEFDINNIPKDLKNKKAFKPVKFIFDNVDSTNSNEKPYLPIFMIESLSELYAQKPGQMKEVIKASKTTGFENASISQILGDMYLNLNLYDNNITVLNKIFTSPISDNAIPFYKFYLEDSIYEDGHRLFHIRFKQRRPGELVFEGNMWIADSTWGIKRIEMSIAKDANINFINALNVIQEYKLVDSTWFIHRDKLVIDFAIKKNSPGIYGRKTSSYKSISTNLVKEKKFFESSSGIDVQDSATKRDETFWKKYRHDSLSKNEKKIYAMMDTVQNLPVYRTWLDLVTIFVTGYKTYGNFELGPLFTFVSFNTLEGPRLRFGGRTSNAFSKIIELNGYGAYGFKDEQFKFGLGFKMVLGKKPWQLVGFDYKSDIEVLGQSDNQFATDNFFAALGRRLPLRSLIRGTRTTAWYEKDFFPGFTTRFTFLNKQYERPSDVDLFSYTQPDGKIGEKTKLTTTEFQVNFRYARGEKYVESAFQRSRLGSKSPVVNLQLVKSLPKVYGAEYDYTKIVVNVNDRINFNTILGYGNFNLEAGKYWGNVPYPFMELHAGNGTVFYDFKAYNMQNFFEFISDQYAQLWYTHHFDGILFNKIPLIKKLKWREVASFKTVVGTVNKSNKDLIVFPERLYDLSKGPYYEAGIGLENIFKIIRLDAVWRLNYLNNPDITKFKVGISVQLQF
jgi:Family of unknown function (DUF5686)/CarboxypepD_reg-like domain